ncbi:hypothetical protein OF83DRAFT_1174925 [Amylostereum chailletii]|nr:hypothetical protein OF83DRAFT_1174925 [Amylostereum chailletii]
MGEAAEILGPLEEENPGLIRKCKVPARNTDIPLIKNGKMQTTLWDAFVAIWINVARGPTPASRDQRNFKLLPRVPFLSSSHASFPISKLARSPSLWTRIDLASETIHAKPGERREMALPRANKTPRSCNSGRKQPDASNEYLDSLYVSSKSFDGLAAELTTC